MPHLSSASCAPQSLAELLRDGPLSPQQAALIGFEIAQLVDSHARAAIRRSDLTPDAVLIDGSARIRLARGAQRPVTRKARAPLALFRIRDRSSRPSDASLVEGLGELLETMLVGCCDGSGSKISARRGRRSEQLSKRLLAICRKATSRDPGRRHRSVRRFAREVGAFLFDHAPEAV